MKRMICLALCVMTVFALCACGEDKPAAVDEPVEATQQETSAPASATDDEADPDGLKSFIARFDDTPTVGDKPVYSDSKMTVTAHGINYAPVAGPELHLEIGNNFGKDVNIQAPYAVVNGYMITPELSLDVPAGKSATGNLRLPYFDLAIADITCIRTIEFSLRVVEPKSYNPIHKTEVLSVTTSAADLADAELTFDDSGQVGFDEDGIKIVFKGVSKARTSTDGAALTVYMYNGTEKSVAVQANEVTVNGYKMTSAMNRSLLPDRHAVVHVPIYAMEMEENGIDTIDSIKISFIIRDAETWDQITSTDLISVDLGQTETTPAPTKAE